jgi:uncharacterized LabA/DUF88 family protein
VKVSVYIDAFNLYFGLMERGLANERWLDLRLLSTHLFRPNESLVSVKFFTSFVKDNPDKEKRQRTYLSALQHMGVEIIHGNYQKNIVSCKRCGHSWRPGNEKMADVNIATHLIFDAVRNKYDKALLVSGDTDLVPPVVEI